MNGGWSRDALIVCDANGCPFSTSTGKEAMAHALETGHSLTGDGPFEGSILTVSLVRDGEEDSDE